MSLSLNALKNSDFDFMNPVEDNFEISTNDNFIAFIKIYNVMGQQVVSKKTNNVLKIKINVSNLEAGIYFFSLKTAKGLYQSKFLKE